MLAFRLSLLTVHGQWKTPHECSMLMMSPLTDWRGVSDKGIEVLVGEMEGSDLTPRQRGEQ